MTFDANIQNSLWMSQQQGNAANSNNMGGAIGALAACVGFHFNNAQGAQGTQGIFGSYIGGIGAAFSTRQGSQGGLAGIMQQAYQDLQKISNDTHQTLVQNSRDIVGPLSQVATDNSNSPDSTLASHNSNHGMGEWAHGTPHTEIASSHGTGVTTHVEVGALPDFGKFIIASNDISASPITSGLSTRDSGSGGSISLG